MIMIMTLKRNQNQKALKVNQKCISVKWMLRFFETTVIIFFQSEFFIHLVF